MPSRRWRGQPVATSTGEATTAESGANRGPRSHLKIRLAFTVQRRETLATQTLGAVASKQIDRFT